MVKVLFTSTDITILDVANIPDAGLADTKATKVVVANGTLCLLGLFVLVLGHKAK